MTAGRRRSTRRASLALIVVLAAPGPAVAQEDGLRSGPMVGYGDMREVLLWAQTTRPARVQFFYADTAQPGRVYATEVVETRSEEALVARAVADSVEPGRRYRYEIRIDGQTVERSWPLRFQTQTLWQHRTDPPAFRMALASCFYVGDPPYDRPGRPYGGDYGILAEIVAERPDLMLWLGDNTYLREADWHTRTGIFHRYAHTRALPELQPLLGSTHHYAIWDDHDYGPNDSNRSYPRKGVARQAFELFWGNPPFTVEGLDGTTNAFQWADVDVFLLDDRWHRAPNHRRTGERSLLGERQFEWLIDALATSKAPFKLIVAGGQWLNPSQIFENYANYPEERERLLEAIAAERIEGVVFLSGDRHHTELTRLERAGAYPLYDLTVSPLTAGVAEPLGDENPIRVNGTLVVARNFATLDFSGPGDDRAMTIRVMDAGGRERWARTLRAAELTYAD